MINVLKKQFFIIRSCLNEKNIEIGIIGSTGFIGNSITKQVNSFLGFNTKNLDEF